MPNPLEALRGAQHIGPTMFDNQQLTNSAVPGPPPSGILAGLRGLFSRAAPVAEEALPASIKALGEVSAEHAPLGGEAAYNATRPAPRVIQDPLEVGYNRIMERFNQGPR